MPTEATEPYTFSCQVARAAPETAAYFALRRAIFCGEQGLFERDDRDDCDDGAYPIVCLAIPPNAPQPEGGPRVVGVVRIWEEAPGDWWGGRLGVDADFRCAALVGRRLVQHAVGTARAWGAWRFRALVQEANVPFFRRLRWHSVAQPQMLLGRPHELMQAALDRYVDTTEVRPGGGSPARAPSPGDHPLLPVSAERHVV